MLTYIPSFICGMIPMLMSKRSIKFVLSSILNLFLNYVGISF